MILKILALAFFIVVFVYLFLRAVRYIIRFTNQTNYLLKSDLVRNLTGHPSLKNKTIIIPPRYFEPDEIKEIIIFKLDHIGDIILSAPALRAIREGYPKARITLACGSWAKDILGPEGLIDHFLEINMTLRSIPHAQKRAEKKKLLAFLRQNHFDLAIDLRTSRDMRYLLKAARATWKVGFRTFVRDGFMDICVTPVFPYRQAHQVEQMLEIPRALGLKTNHPAPALRLTAEEKAYAAAFCEQHMPQGSILVGMHPSAGSPSRIWHPERFAALADKLMENPKVRVALLVGKGDLPLAAKIRDLSKKEIIVISDASIRQSAAIIQKCHLFISNNSGPMHLAASVDTPTIGIFSGMDLPNEWAPYGEKHRIIISPVCCMPCYKGECKRKKMYCLESITVEQVYNAALAMLAEYGQPPSEERNGKKTNES